MLTPRTKWLLSGVINTQSNVAKEALANGADPDKVTEDNQMSALQEAIQREDLELTNLLLVTHTANETVADVNLVGHEFKSSIAIASKAKDKTKRMHLMRMIIQNRKVFDEKLFDCYFNNCCALIKSTTIFDQDDFAVLSHYASRLCGIEIGQLLNTRNNDDRYLIHLCQYSFAQKNNDELEGWNAFEFLPIRIFSLFEILIKLNKGIISTPNTTRYQTLIRQEILSERETFKIEEERTSIASAELDEKETNELYYALANTLLDKILFYPNKEFHIASGYRGHMIYISFQYDDIQNAIIIRYDNLGAGVEKLDRSPRHFIDPQKEVIYPRIIKVPFTTSNDKQKLLDYITRLFIIKNQNLPENPNKSDPNYVNKREIYLYEREEMLIKIYDDILGLSFDFIRPQAASGMHEQEASTCVATSHQVGLLIRLNDPELYHWIVAEEKRCIVQHHRNAGASAAKQPKFWNESTITYQAPEFSAACSRQPVEDIINPLLLEKCTQSMPPQLNQLFETFKKWLFLTKSGLIELEAAWLTYLDKFPLGRVISALITFRLADLEPEHSVIILAQLDKTQRLLLEYLSFAGSDARDINLSRIYYFSGLCAYQKHDFNQTKLKWEMCLKICINAISQLESSKKSHSIYMSSFFQQEPSEQEKLLIFYNQLKDYTLCGLGFLMLTEQKYKEAEEFFEKTVTYTYIQHGMRTIGAPSKRVYPPAALLGLGIVYHQYSYDEQYDETTHRSYEEKALHCYREVQGSNGTNLVQLSRKHEAILKRRIHDKNKELSVVSNDPTEPGSLRRKTPPLNSQGSTDSSSISSSSSSFSSASSSEPSRNRPYK